MRPASGLSVLPPHRVGRSGGLRRESDGDAGMTLAKRLAILCGSAVVAVILANILFTIQTNRISALYEERAAARNSQITAIDVGRDVQTFLATYNRLLFTSDPAQQ